jgi:hypothetical protein
VIGGRRWGVVIGLNDTFEIVIAAVRRYVPWPDGRWQDDEGTFNFVLPAEVHVESRAVRPADFEHVVAPLERLFRASARRATRSGGAE